MGMHGWEEIMDWKSLLQYDQQSESGTRVVGMIVIRGSSGFMANAVAFRHTDDLRFTWEPAVEIDSAFAFGSICQSPERTCVYEVYPSGGRCLDIACRDFRLPVSRSRRIVHKINPVPMRVSIQSK